MALLWSLTLFYAVNSGTLRTVHSRTGNSSNMVFCLHWRKKCTVRTVNGTKHRTEHLSNTLAATHNNIGLWQWSFTDKHSCFLQKIKKYIGFAAALVSYIQCVTDSPQPFPTKPGVCISFSCLFSSFPIFSQFLSLPHLLHHPLFQQHLSIGPLVWPVLRLQEVQGMLPVRLKRTINHFLLWP